MRSTNVSMLHAGMVRTLFALALALPAGAANAASGQLDTSFNTNGKKTIAFDLYGLKTDDARAVAAQVDGKLVVAGTVVVPNGTAIGLVRLNTNGTLDTSFGTNGKTIVDWPYYYEMSPSIAITADGRIVVAGRALSNNGWNALIYRLLPNGTTDTSFSNMTFTPGGYVAAALRDVALDASGRIVVVGDATKANGNTDIYVLRMKANGDDDPTFNNGFDRTVALDHGDGDAYTDVDTAGSVAIQADGRIVVGGTTQYHSYDTDYVALRFNADGSFDNTFSSDGQTEVAFDVTTTHRLDRLSSIAVAADGHIYLAGTVDATVAGDTGVGVVSLQSNGNLDTAFDSDGKRVVRYTSSTLSDEGSEIMVQSNGKLLIAGSADFGDSSPTHVDFAAARLNVPSGSSDSTFSNGSSGAAYGFDTASSPRDDLGLGAALVGGKLVIVGSAQWNGDDTDYGVMRILLQ